MGACGSRCDSSVVCSTAAMRPHPNISLYDVILKALRKLYPKTITKEPDMTVLEAESK